MQLLRTVKKSKIIACITAFAALTSCQSNQLTADSIDEIEGIGITIENCASIKVGKSGTIPRGSDVYPLRYILERQDNGLWKQDNGLWNLIEIAGHGGDDLAVYPGDDYDHNIFENISQKEYEKLFEHMLAFHVKPHISPIVTITLADMYKENTSDYAQSKSPIKIYFRDSEQSYYWLSTPETMSFYYDFFNKMREIAKKRGSYLEVTYKNDGD